MTTPTERDDYRRRAGPHTVYVQTTSDFMNRLLDDVEAQARKIERLRAFIDQAYRERNELAAAVAPYFEGWLGDDPDAPPDWRVLYLELPTGQISYHFSPSDAGLLDHVQRHITGIWDGHMQEQRSERLAALSGASTAGEAQG